MSFLSLELISRKCVLWLINYPFFLQMEPSRENGKQCGRQGLFSVLRSSQVSVTVHFFVAFH